jgi:quercetin dioxygenase-like cupin family protein
MLYTQENEQLSRSIENSEHYFWGEACDGWILSPDRAMMVIQERMPPHTAEKRHYHAVARQFFYVLSGVLTMELDGEYHRVTAMSGIAIPPAIRHQARNDDSADVHFLVVSSPTTRGDRIDTE